MQYKLFFSLVFMILLLGCANMRYSNPNENIPLYVPQKNASPFTPYEKVVKTYNDGITKFYAPGFAK